MRGISRSAVATWTHKHRERTDVADGPGRVKDPGDQHDRRQAGQHERQQPLGVAAGQTPLSDPRLPRSEQQNGETHDPVEDDQDIAPGRRPDRLGGQTRGESARSTASATPGWCGVR